MTTLIGILAIMIINVLLVKYVNRKCDEYSSEMVVINDNNRVKRIENNVKKMIEYRKVNLI